MSKMKKCSRVKNPCKICLESVTRKTGIQCKGACKKWAHFTCLNYTPGKIQDIKAGIITITCPCPNCNTQEPKEFLTDPPYTCTNQECPANKLPTCQINECPLNSPDTNATYQNVSPQATQMGPMPCGPGCSASQTSHHTPPASSPEMTRIPPVSPPVQQPHTPPPSAYQPMAEELNPCASASGVPQCMSQPIAPQRASPRSIRSQSPHMASTPTRTSRTPSQREFYPENRAASPNREASPLVRSRSCSCLSGQPGDMMNSGETINTGTQGHEDTNGGLYDAETVTLKGGDCKAACSDSRIINNNSSKENQRMLLCSIQKLCSTVGHLSTQIKDLMCKMLNNLEKEAL